MTQYDVLLSSSLGLPPFVIGSRQPKGADKFGMTLLNHLPIAGFAQASGIINKIAHDMFCWIPYTPLQNITGQPSISLPLHTNAEGLPVGMMFGGQFGDEATLLRLAAQLEQAQPWADKRPALS